MSVHEIPAASQSELLLDRQVLRKSLPELSIEQREAVLMHHVWGFTYSEIGGIIGVAPGTVKLRVFRGMKRLKEIVGASGVTGTVGLANSKK